jgi:lipoprotein-anchoring transpeptidase ErfK/SrfK
MKVLTEKESGFEQNGSGNRPRFRIKARIHSNRLVSSIIAIVLSSSSSILLSQERKPIAEAHGNRNVAASGTRSRPGRLSISKINNSDTKDVVRPGSSGDAVVRAAILLDRLKFSPGVIGTGFTKNLESAIKAFQLANGLPRSGVVDSATWRLLNESQESGDPAGTLPASQQQSSPQPPQASQAEAGHTSKAIDTYVVTIEDVAGPFTQLPRVQGRDAGEQLMLKEAKLKQLNYGSPLELLAEKFHSSPHLLMDLNPGKVFTKAGAELKVPNVDTPAPSGLASIVVDAASRRLNVLDGNGKVLASYPATIGSVHDPLPIGMWKVEEVSWYPHYHYNPNLFWDADEKDARATLAPGPKNPVGVVWIGLSKEHYGIHGTPVPSTIGLTASHGCVRLTNWDATELGKMAHVGTTVVMETAASAPVAAKPQE